MTFRWPNWIGLAGELPHYWDNIRYDYFTFRGAEESIKRDKPRVLYVAFGETDDWAHAGRYDLYLDAARRTDDYIERLWKTMQSLPQYAGKTSLLITTDHGRGDTLTGWKSHGTDHPGSDEIWIALLSPDIAHAAPGDCDGDPVTGGGHRRCPVGGGLPRFRAGLRTTT